MFATKRIAWILVAALPLGAVACGGAKSGPASPSGASDDSKASETGANAGEASTGPKKSDENEGWEGEGEAKGASSAAQGTASATPADSAGAPAAATGGTGPKKETRTMEVIRNIVMAHRAPVRKCYEDALKDLPTLKGDLVIHFVLDPQGKVQKIELNQERSTLKAPSVAACAIDVIKNLAFPPSSLGKETTVNYPYNLNPQKTVYQQ